jgi:hypothetical protein
MDDWAKFMKRVEGMDGADLERMRQKRRAARAGLPPKRIVVSKKKVQGPPAKRASRPVPVGRRKNMGKGASRATSNAKTKPKSERVLRSKVSRLKSAGATLEEGDAPRSNEEMAQVMALLERADREIAAEASAQASNEGQRALKATTRTNRRHRVPPRGRSKQKLVGGLSVGARAMAKIEAQGLDGAGLERLRRQRRGVRGSSDRVKGVATKENVARAEPRAVALSAGARAMARSKPRGTRAVDLPQRTAPDSVAPRAEDPADAGAPRPGDLPFDDVLRAIDSREKKARSALPPWKAELEAARAAAKKRTIAAARARADAKARALSEAADSMLAERETDELVRRIAAKKAREDAAREAEAADEAWRRAQEFESRTRREAAQRAAEANEEAARREAETAAVQRAEALERARDRKRRAAAQAAKEAEARRRAEAEAEAIMAAAKAKVIAEATRSAAADRADEGLRSSSAQPVAAALGGRPADAAAVADALERATGGRRSARPARTGACELPRPPRAAPAGASRAKKAAPCATRPVASAPVPGPAAASSEAKAEGSNTAPTRAAPTRASPTRAAPTRAAPTRAAPSIAARAARWDAAARRTAEAEATNVFSSKFDAARHEAQRLCRGDAGYGTAPEGSESAARADKAKAWVDGQVLLLLETIRDMSCPDAEGHVSVPFGELFTAYETISDSLVGMLLRAKRRRQIAYEGEMLLQRYHDDVRIRLTKKGRAFVA